jgi:ribosomal protein S19E (S16A)
MLEERLSQAQRRLMLELQRGGEAKGVCGDFVCIDGKPSARRSTLLRLADKEVVQRTEAGWVLTPKGKKLARQLG